MKNNNQMLALLALLCFGVSVFAESGKEVPAGAPGEQAKPLEVEGEGLDRGYENEEEESPFATMEGMERLLKEQGDKLSAQEKYQIRAWIDLFKTPINFWALVVDTNGRPMPGAKVHVEVRDDPNMDWEADRKNTEYELIADEEGKVQLLDIRGAGLIAEASAEGFAPSYNQSQERSLSKVELSVGANPDEKLVSWPTAEKPQKLTLREKGPIPRIKYQETRYLRPTPDGEVMKLDLCEGKYLVEVRFWSSRPENAELGDRWEWRVEYRPVAGQIRKRAEYKPYAAPIDGFEDRHEILMKATNEDWQWSNIGRRSHYWIRWNDGTHAMVNLGIESDPKPRLSVESWINLDRNRSFEDCEGVKWKKIRRR